MIKTTGDLIKIILSGVLQMNRITGLYTVVAILTAIFLMLIGGCSSGKSNPVMSNNDIPDMSVPVTDQGVEGTNHKLSGMWTVTFDPQTMSAEITPDRALNSHWNVTSLLPTPSIEVTGFDPVSEVIDVDVTITNPYSLDAYDVRLIIFTDATGNRLMNADNWTALYDIPGGLPINPFKAYPFEHDERIFEGFSEKTRDLSIHIPVGNTSITFAIDASYPGACEEPYRIYFSNMLDKLFDHLGSSVLIKASVSDHQYDVDSVELNCPEITGELLVPFYQDGNLWKMELENVTGAPVGEYPGWILAKSANSGSITLYEAVTIRVYPEGDYPYDPKVIGEYTPFSDSLADVCTQGDFAYVSTGDPLATLRIVNISDPSNPVSMGSVSEFPDDWMLGLGELVVQGDYLYTPATRSGYDSWLLVIDISDPWNPSCVGKSDLGDKRYFQIAIKDNWVYLAPQPMGGDILIVDVTTPTDPSIVGEIEGSSWDAEVQGDYLYATRTNRSLSVYDISSPWSPVEVTNLSFFPLFQPKWLSVEGDIAVINAFQSSFFKVIDISDPANPIELAEERFAGYSTNIDIAGDYVYFTCSPYDDEELNIFDISDPSAPVFASTIELTNPYDVVVDGNFACVVDMDMGLIMYDVSNPETPLQTGRMKRTDMKSVDINGDFAYVADGKYGYSIFDITNNESPQNVVSFDTPDTEDIVVRDNYAYIIGGRDLVDDYFKILDFTDPFNPVEIGSLDAGPGVNIKSMLIDGMYAYLCAGERGLIIVDISNPSSPGPVYWVNIPNAIEVAIEGDYAYVASSAEGMFVVNISNPSTPQIVGSTLTDGKVWHIDVQGEYAYIIDGGLSVVDISQPDNPQYITGTSHISSHGGMTVEGDYVYVSGAGLTVFDVSDPANPERFSIDDTIGSTGDIQVIDNLAYMVGGVAGFRIVELWE